MACGAVMPEITQFIASTDVITLDEPIRVLWDVEHADEVWIEGGDEPLPLYGQEDVYLYESCTFVIVAKSAAGEVRKELSFTLPAPQIMRFGVDSREIDLNYPTIFSWETTNADTITIEPHVGEVSGLTFCEAKPRTPGVYELVVKNASGEARSKVFLTLSKPEIGLFQILQEHVEPGEPHLLHWEVENADKIILMPDYVDVTGLTQVEVFPVQSTNYQLLVSNGAGTVEAEAYIPLPLPKIKTFTAPDPISTEGASIVLRWDVKYAYRVEIEPGIGEVPVTGELKYKPTQAFTEFRLKAVGRSGIQTATLTVSRFPLPIEDLDEDQLFRDMSNNLRKQEKMLREQPDIIAAARLLPHKIKDDSDDTETLPQASVTREIKHFFRGLLNKKP
ncbi:MAG: hypothetical protein NWR72_01090 [Bacteroidia bacterium]|nr:hypothetical protein [Bacteroidia bacterium]